MYIFRDKNIYGILVQKKIIMLTLLFFVACLLISPNIQGQPYKMALDFDSCKYGSTAEILDTLNNRLFIITYGNDGRNLWTFDGLNTPEMIPRSCTDPICFGPSGKVIFFNNRLYFSAYYGETYGSELWSYDGINQPVLVCDLATGPAYSNPENFILFKNKLCFTAANNFENRELWTYDGINPPSMLMDIYPGPKGSDPSSLFVFNDRLFFQANDSVHGRELWSYDGINVPAIYADLNIGKGDGLNGFNPVLINKKLYFAANDGIHGFEPYVFDGTNQPAMIYDINPGTAGSLPAFFDSVYNDTFYLSANDGVHGNELWLWDGKSAPNMFADMSPGSYLGVPNGFSPGFICIFKDKLYFRGSQGIYNYGIWEYDGTNMKCITTDIHFGNFAIFTGTVNYDNKLFFMVRDGEPGNRGGQFWFYDGTNPPTRVADIHRATPSALTPFKNKLYFSMEDSCESRELFVLCSTYSESMITACQNYDFNGKRLTESGIYYDTVPNMSGCDSIITLHLTIVDVDTAITVNDDLLVASAGGSHYQWVDCENNYRSLPGKTNQSFQVSQSGNYAVIVSKNNCTDTSKCLAVHITGIPDNKNESGISLYPNPVKEELIIEFNQEITYATIEIRDVNGVLVLQNHYMNNKLPKVDVSSLQQGVYFVKLVTDKGTSSSKIIK